jgi:hypothetical protein
MWGIWVKKYKLTYLSDKLHLKKLLQSKEGTLNTGINFRYILSLR